MNAVQLCNTRLYYRFAVVRTIRKLNTLIWACVYCRTISIPLQSHVEEEEKKIRFAVEHTTFSMQISHVLIKIHTHPWYWLCVNDSQVSCQSSMLWSGFMLAIHQFSVLYSYFNWNKYRKYCHFLLKEKQINHSNLGKSHRKWKLTFLWNRKSMWLWSCN